MSAALPWITVFTACKSNMTSVNIDSNTGMSSRMNDAHLSLCLASFGVIVRVDIIQITFTACNCFDIAMTPCVCLC